MMSPVLHAAPPDDAALADRQANLGELRGRIDALRKELSASEGSRASAADRLRESEHQISRLQRELHQLATQRSQLQQGLQNLETQSKELAGTLRQQQTQLERMLYRQYLRGSPDNLQLLLNGDDPNQLARDLHYLSAIAHARSDLMSGIDQTLRQKRELAANARERSDELAQVEAEQKTRHTELEQQRRQRQAVHAEISDKVKAQRREIGNLQRDEKRLSQLVDRLSKLLAAQAKEAAARQARARQAAQLAARQREANPDKPAKPSPAAEARSSPKREVENHYEPMANDGSFRKLRGQLRLPVKGAVSGRFGGARDGGGTWRGLFIRAADGTPVKAVAGGRIVFADWMRGFGNLLIIDHGNAYLSIYGNNDSLLKQVGDAVNGGETIASVGNTGGNPESGLYFEIRHQGQPIDPLQWASLK